MSEKQPYHPNKFAKDVQQLVQINSVSGNEMPAQQHLLWKFQNFGTTLPESAGFSAWLQPVESYESPNLIAHVKGNSGKGAKKALILTGHVDTVSPAGKPEEWTGGSPWSGEIVEQVDGKHALHGLGASDMKMGLTVLQHVFQDLAQRSDLNCDVWFVSAINEEKNGAGTQAFAKWFQEQGLVDQYPQGIAAIFGEPRNLGSNKTILGIGNKVNDFLIASKIVGSRHSSELGPNVADDMVVLGQRLTEMDSKWQGLAVEEGFTPPHVTITKLDTPNNNLNATATNGSVGLDLRTTPATQQGSYEQIVKLAKSLGFNVTHADIPAPGSYTSPDSSIVKAFQDVLMKEGVEVNLKTTPGSTDAGFLQEIGITQNIIAGAGLEEQEHHVDEYAILEDGERAIGLTVQAALKWIEMMGDSQVVTTRVKENNESIRYPKLLKVFGTEQPLIGMVHLLPLPGYPGHPGMDALMADAMEKLHALKKAGFNGVLVENDGDTPPFPGKDIERRDQVRAVMQQIVAKADGIPVGLEILYDDLGTFQVANEAGAKFVRFDVYVDNVETARGAEIHGQAEKVQELKDYLGSDLLIVADVHVKHATVTDGKTLEESAKLAEQFGADVICVTGEWTGKSPNLADLHTVREVVSPGVSVAVGSGATVENIETLFSHGANVVIVGSSLKTDGRIDPDKALTFMQAAHKAKEAAYK